MNFLNKLSACALVCGITAAFAAGFSILEQSPSGIGRALAGMTAETNDPSSLYYNPSSVAWFDHPSLVLGTHILTGNCRFHDTGHSTMDGGKSGDIIGTSFIPNLAYVHPLGDGLTLNLTMSATSGTETNYPWDWMGRYFAVNTSIAVIEFQPSIAYRITDDLSIGIGLMGQYADMEMEQALDVPAAGLPRNDTRMKLEGDTFTCGFTAGVTWKALERTTLGLSYRSKMSHDFDLDASYKRGYASVYSGVLGGDADLSLDMPQSVNFGIVQELTPSWKIMADVAWTDWSVMDEMKVKFKKNGVESTEVMKWHDSWRFALGTEYKIDEKWTVRAGTAFDERAVTNHYTKTCKLPDSNRYWMSMGCSYQYSEHMRLDLAWTHIIFQPSSIHQTHTDGRYIDGKVSGYTNLISVGMKYDF